MTPDKHNAKLRKLTGLCDDDNIDTATARVIKARMPTTSHFVAIRLSDDSIHSSVAQNVHKAADEKLKPAFASLKELHLSLLYIHLKDQKQIKKAQTALQQCKTKIQSVLPSGAFTLKFKGLDYFYYPQEQLEDQAPPKEVPRVLYVKPSGKEGIKILYDVAGVVKNTFESQGIHSTDTRKWTPHVTVINLNNTQNSEVEGVSEIPQGSFKDCLNLDYGEQQVSNLCLCQIGTTADDGFYEVVEKIGFEPGAGR